MTAYKHFDPAEAATFIPKAWDMHFDHVEERDPFVETRKRRELADCSEFQLNASDTEKSRIFFFVDDPRLEKFLEQITEQIYLYGSYNQILVCSMRTLGSVTLVTDDVQIAEIARATRSRIKGRINSTGCRIKEAEAGRLHEIINVGKLFCFKPVSHEYYVYERG